MKKINLLIPLLLFAFLSQAQNEVPNPYESIGKKAETLTLSYGKYQEFFGNDTLRRMGNIVYNTVERKIEYVVQDSIVMSEDGMDVHIVSRWLSRDPLAKKNSGISPYAAFNNSPMVYIDPNGMDTLMVHRKTIGERGRTRIYKVTFSLVRDGMEKKLDYELYMAGHSEYADIQMKDNEDYKMILKQMGSHPEWKHTFYIENDGGFNIFVHPKNWVQGNTGCYAVSETEPEIMKDEDDGYWLNKTDAAQNKLLYIYNEADGGKNGDKLTGDKMILKTESIAKDNYNLDRIEPIPATTIETTVEAKIEEDK